MNTAENQALWAQRATLGERAGTDDLLLKQIEQRAIIQQLMELGCHAHSSVVDLGCGHGDTAALIAEEFNCQVVGVDSSPEMIRAGQYSNLVLGSVEDIPEQRDFIYTQRTIINQPTWEAQAEMIRQILSRLKSGGHYLMCESSLDGLNEINLARVELHLEPISPPPHTLYIVDDTLDALDKALGYPMQHRWDFSSEYYRASRIYNAKQSSEWGIDPPYDALLNRWSLMLPMADGPYAQTRLWVWRKA